MSEGEDKWMKRGSMTVGELKESMEQLSDEDEVFIYGCGIGSTVYDVSEICHRIKCVEHNGKKWTANGLILCVD